MASALYEEITKRTWSATKRVFLDLHEDSSFWIFRGQANPNWPLRTTIERELTYSNSENQTIESELVSEFKRAARNYLGPNQIPTTEIEWLALMQHYGAPTRLIDFTKSPYVASYFAFEDPHNEHKYTTVWAVQSYDLMVQSTKTVLRLVKGDTDLQKMARIALWDDQRVHLVMQNKVSFTCPIEPELMNERFRSQQGSFLMSGNINESVETNLSDMNLEEPRRIFKKINIPVAERAKVISDLYLMNITPATLFPGLDGYARYIKSMPEFLRKKLFSDFEKKLKLEN